MVASPSEFGDRPWFRVYPPEVPRHVIVPDQLLTELIEESVRRWPDRNAIVYYAARWSYRRFWQESERLAASLAREGVGAGDRVALYLPNVPAYPIAFFAILRLGAVVVPVSPLYLGQDLARLLRDATPKALVTLETLYPNLVKVRGEYAVPTVFVARSREFYPWYRRPFVNGLLRRQKMSTAFPKDPSVRPWKAAVTNPGTVALAKSVPRTTAAVLQYTGGTTGLPKAAILTHRNLVANVVQGNAWNIWLEPGAEVVIAAIPLSHIYGLTVALLMGLAAGGTVVLQTRPEIRELLKLIDRYQPTQFPGVPALYQSFNRQPDLAERRVQSIRYCLSGSAPLPIEVQRRFEQLTGARLVEGYGLSETSPITHQNPLAGERRVGSIGVPVPETDQRVVDLETGMRVLGAGEVGELCVRGPQVMMGYYRQAEETDLVLKDGWLRTGDVVRVDEDGFAYLVDRKKDLVNVGGMKVYPREVEEVLFQHPAVADVAVVGAPDPERGEAVVAFVVKKPNASVTPEELVTFVRERIAHYKAPHRVEFREALPRSGAQKVLRRVLRAEAAASSPPVAPQD
ncbi:MAG: long-chain-fatty-acid--CoA ligase [Thermoplasmata archaeon]